MPGDGAGGAEAVGSGGIGGQGTAVGRDRHPEARDAGGSSECGGE
jgi:hypothetical protein